MGEGMSSGELRSDLMLRLREGRCGELEVGKEHPPLDILEIAGGGNKRKVQGCYYDYDYCCCYYYC